MTPAAKLKTAIFALILAQNVCACACTVIVVGRNASADGSVIAAQTADGMFDSNVTVVRGRDFPADAMADVFWNLNGHGHGLPEKIGEIPQVRKTYTYFHVGYPFMNEHQLAMGESTLSQQGKLQT